MKQNFQKNKAATGKTAFFVIGSFYNPHSICLNISFWEGSFVWVCYAFNPRTLTTKQYSSFLKKVFVFQKICFKVKACVCYFLSNFYF